MELADPAENPKSECRSIASASSGFGLRASFDIRHSELYVPRTLKHDLRTRGALPVAECIQIALSLTRALEHLHAHGLVHPDSES